MRLKVNAIFFLFGFWRQTVPSTVRQFHLPGPLTLKGGIKCKGTFYKREAAQRRKTARRRRSASAAALWNQGAVRSPHQNTTHISPAHPSSHHTQSLMNGTTNWPPFFFRPPTPLTQDHRVWVGRSPCRGQTIRWRALYCRNHHDAGEQLVWLALITL